MFVYSFLFLYCLYGTLFFSAPLVKTIEMGHKISRNFYIIGKCKLNVEIKAADYHVNRVNLYFTQIVSFLTVFLLHTAMMVSFNKGQLPAKQTKVVDHGLRPLKAGSTRLCVLVCNHDTASSKFSFIGRGLILSSRK